MSKKTWAYIVFTLVFVIIFSLSASKVAGSCGRSDMTFISLPLVVIWSFVTAIALSEKFFKKNVLVLRFLMSLVFAITLSFIVGKFVMNVALPIFGADRNTKNCSEW